jgi:hypothetical protein
MGNRRKRFLPCFRVITKTGGISPAARRDQNMPAHIGAFTKLKVFGQFLMVNLGQSSYTRKARYVRRGAKNFRNMINGTPDAPNNRARYVPLKRVMEWEERKLKKFEREFLDYETFRRFLDEAGPAKGHPQIDQREWDLYLQPGTHFDNTVWYYFLGKCGKLLVIRHQHNRKLKRIEALPKDEEPVVIWSDAVAKPEEKEELIGILQTAGLW